MASPWFLDPCQTSVRCGRWARIDRAVALGTAGDAAVLLAIDEQVNGSPSITGNWEADSAERWSISIGLPFFKIQFFEKLTDIFRCAAMYYLEQPSILPQDLM